MTFEDVEQALGQRLEAFPPTARAELLHILTLPAFDRVDRIGEFWSYPQSRTFAEADRLRGSARGVAPRARGGITRLEPAGGLTWTGPLAARVCWSALG